MSLNADRRTQPGARRRPKKSGRNKIYKGLAGYETEENKETNKDVEEQLKAVQSAVENVSERLNSARDPVVQIDLHEQLQPLQEKMEAMSSAMKTMRDKRAQTPPTPGRNLERELAEAHKSCKSQTSYAEAAAKSPTPRPNHTLIVSQGQTHTGEHVLQIIREAIDTKKSGAKVERVRSQEPKGDIEMQHERGHGGHPEQNEVP
ncbi:hypothetical protein EVAR_85878_1 [Eumeta japonica]|uniref:Uncharacterized protein n=1 Tax=Eumeta variegata TaxID=151549 RepID=A0A4C2A467_EUMVA|nr:hypothetical protein EVAR_85878_1 [Eumeta japonica]